MNPTKLALAAASVTLLAGMARAETPSPEFNAFSTVCGATDAGYDAAMAAAAAHGWTSSDAAPDPTLAGVTVANQGTRATTAGKTGLVLSVWSGTLKSGVKISDCAVHVQATNYDALKSDAGGWLKFAPAVTTPKKVVFRFTNADGAPKALTAAEYDAAAAGAGLEILTITGDANGTILDLMMIKK